MRKKIHLYLLLFFFWAIGPVSFAQSPLFKFGITKSGVYKITEANARQLGFANLSDISFYGYPGMLPQKLDSAQFSHQEIPSWESGNALFVYLEGPTRVRFDEQSEIEFIHHFYTDTLHYLIGRNATPKRIQETQGNQSNPSADVWDVWYSFKWLKEEKTNILNSGRSWYSDPIRQGQSLSVNFGVSSSTSAPWILKSTLMAQSSGTSLLRMLTGDQLIGRVDFNPIPSTTYGIKGREETVHLEFSPPNGRLNQLRFTFQGSGAGYLDYVTVGIPYSGDQLPEGIFQGKKDGLIKLTPNTKTWEVSNFYNPKAFGNGNSASGKSWALFTESNVPAIQVFQEVVHNPLEGSKPEFIIITVPQFEQAAERLKAHKEVLGISSEVVFTPEIFDWYGYGNRDVTAIRNFIAANYRAGRKLKNVLILGKGTFDYKDKLKGRPNLIPIYTSRSSLDPLTTYSSDDYLAMVDWGQGEWEESTAGDEALKIGIGRIPGINFREVSTWIEKIISYENLDQKFPPSSVLTFLADDGDNAIHMRDAEVHANYLTENHPFFRSEKLYLDRFKQEKSGTRQSSVATSEAIEKSLDRGSLFVNYIGHGNETTLTAEEIFKVPDLENWTIQNQPALWVTATCEFGRHDSPFLRSAAEELLFANGKGALGLLTTGRPVFSSINFKLNQAFIQEVFKTENGFYQDLGSIYLNTKNKSQNGPLNRNFSLLGDPSLRLKVPDLGIKITSMIDVITKNPIDTLHSLDQVELTGEIIEPLAGASINNFNGTYQLELWDKPGKQRTLGDENPQFEFREENNLLFKGKGEIKEGKFTTRIVVPKEVSKEKTSLNLRISAVDENTKSYAGGLLQAKIDGTIEKESTDQAGPIIQVEVKGETKTLFAISSNQTKVTAKFEDRSGINLSSSNPAQILRVLVNGDKSIFINEFYYSVGGDYKKGEAIFTISDLEEGTNSIEVLAWDNAGNSSKFEFRIEVRGSERIQVLEHFVYPNPSSDQSNFCFTHNRAGENLMATLEVYSLSGQILFSETRRLVKAQEMINDWNWIFFQSKSKYPGKGTYIYNLSLHSESDFTSDTVSGKLVIQ
ncbi:MAG: type IX secretion system sortase PorU [Algoriphagus sp.]|jgi:hypothetical protein|nr:type IX secretion system sortase PorU [Algoriphagus sp.]